MVLLLPLESENPLLPAPIEIILAVVFVLLLTVVISRFVVPRFEATYAERTAAIQGGIEKAEQAQEAAQAALEQYNAQLAEARTEAARIREDAKTQGTQILVELREQAQAEATRIKARARPSSRPSGRRCWPSCAVRSADWPPRWPAGSSVSRSRTTSGPGVRSTGSSPIWRASRRKSPAKAP